MKTAFTFAAIALLGVMFQGCAREDEVVKIDMVKRESTKAAQTGKDEKPLRIAIGGMITPREGYAYYRQFLKYMEKKLNLPIKLVDREDYAEINAMIKAGELDVAFVCGGPYVDGKSESSMELLAAPKAYGETVYYSYIIAPIDSPVEKFEDLRGKRFAFTDPMSNSGKLVPTYMLSKIGETPEKFFGEVSFTYAHDKSIAAAARKIVDGAAVDSLIWEYANRKDPKFSSKTKIILKSPPYGIPPVVARAGMDPLLKEKIQSIFLTAHNDPEGKEILDKMMIDEFVAIEDGAYDSIREMKSWISRHGVETN